MKFVVQKDMFGEYDVKLHWESKDKLKRIAYWGLLVPASAAASVWTVKQIMDDSKK